MENSEIEKATIPSLNNEQCTPNDVLDVKSASLPKEQRGVEWRAFATVAGTAFALFSIYGQLNAFGTYQLYYQQHIFPSLSPSVISWIGSIQLFLSLSLGSISGRLCDRYGPKPTIAAGSFLCTISLIILSFARRLYQFIILQGFLFGIGAGILFAPCIKCVSTHFKSHRATGIGIAMTGSALGGTAYPFIIYALFQHVGFSWSTRVGGLLCLACGVIAYFAVTIAKEANQEDGNEKHDNFFDLSAFKDGKYLMFCFGVSIACFGFYVPYYYLAAYAQSTTHISNQTAISVLSVLNALSAVGRILPTVMADYVGRLNSIAVTGLLAGIACLTVWLQSTSYAAAVGFAAFYGFFAGAFVPLTPACIVDLSEEPTKKKHLGARIGMCYVFISLPMLVGEPIAGAIIKAMHGSYKGCIIFAGLSLLLGSVAIGMVRVWHAKRWRA